MKGIIFNHDKKTIKQLNKFLYWKDKIYMDLITASVFKIEVIGIITHFNEKYLIGYTDFYESYDDKFYFNWYIKPVSNKSCWRQYSISNGPYKIPEYFSKEQITWFCDNHGNKKEKITNDFKESVETDLIKINLSNPQKFEIVR